MNPAEVKEMLSLERKKALNEAATALVDRARKLPSYELAQMRTLNNAAKTIRAMADAE